MAQEVSSSPSTSCKYLLSHQDVPLEELLGSVTTYNSVEGSETKSLQLRQSARVFKKMRLDSAIAAAISVAAGVSGKAGELEKIKEDKLDAKKPLRPFWLPEDKTLFFEALNEHGKEFEAIHSYMKMKKKGAPEHAMKTREQIRHLYHRTWHKISKHLIFSEDVKKVAQELYGLINYGELRKKLVSVSPKTTIKLNELIYRGSMTLRVKGKTIRVKTPMCRALRRLNQLDEKHDDIKLPTRILVELKPKDMATWMHVQEMSQNPRVRSAVPLQKRLSTLIQCMTVRWKTRNTLDFDRILATQKDSSTNASDVKQEIITAEDYEDKRKLLQTLLRLSPLDGAPIHIPNVNLSELFTSHTICMNAYERRNGVSTSGEASWLKAFPGFRTSFKNFYKKAAAAIRRQRSEFGSVCIIQSPPNKINSTLSATNVSATTTDNNENNIVAESGAAAVAAANCSIDDHLMDEYIDEAVNTILALQTSMNGVETATSEGANEDVEAKVKVEDVEQLQQLESKRIQDIEKIKLGWTLEDCGTLSVGDLYLMFGSDSKLELEYSFHHSQQNIKPKLEPNELADQMATLDNTTAPHETCTTTTDPSSLSSLTNHQHDNNLPQSIDNNNVDSSSNEKAKATHNDLSATLKRLLSVAKLHYRRNIVRCPCGHVCNGNTRKEKQDHQRQQKCSVNSAKTAGVNNSGKVIKAEMPDMMGLGTVDGTPLVEGVVMETIPAFVSTSTLIPVTIQPMIRRFQPNTLFRRPNSPNDCLRAQIDSIQRLKPRYCNRMGRRVRTKQMVVERKLPLLPNINESGRQIVQMNIISQDNNSITLTTSSTAVQPRNIAPKITQTQEILHQESVGANRVAVGIMTVATDVCNTNGSSYEGTLTKVNTAYTIIPTVSAHNNGENATTPSRVCSPTSISNLLDIALNSAQHQIDSERKTEGNITSFQGLISQSGNTGSCTPPDSPSRLLRDAESQQWLNSEVADYSLSSLLGHLESPMKTVQSGASINGDDTRLLSQDVDAQLQSLLTESSLDYTAKFADLAAQVSDSKNKETFSNT